LIRFDTATAADGEEVHPGVILHFDATSRIVGIEVLHVSETLSDGAIAHLVAAAE
jgi:hypothetical protein